MDNNTKPSQPTLIARGTASMMLRRMKRKMFLDAVQSNEGSLRSLLGTASQDSNDSTTLDVSVSSFSSDASFQSSVNFKG
jgi:hypothetical protein